MWMRRTPCPPVAGAQADFHLRPDLLQLHGRARVEYLYTPRTLAVVANGIWKDDVAQFADYAKPAARVADEEKEVDAPSSTEATAGRSRQLDFCLRSHDQAWCLRRHPPNQTALSLPLPNKASSEAGADRKRQLEFCLRSHDQAWCLRRHPPTL